MVDRLGFHKRYRRYFTKSLIFDKMNKKLLYLLPLMMVVGCTEKVEGDDNGTVGQAPFTLSVDNEVIESDGKQVATFKITDANGVVLTDNTELMSKIYFKNEATERRLARRTKTFRSVEDGEYVFSATFSGEPCENTVTITSQNRTKYEVFRKNVCLYRFTATWCGNCPSMTEGLDRVNDWTKGRLVELDMHGAGSTYALSDGTRYVADHLVDQFNTGGFPSCVYDLDVMSESRSYSEIEELVFDRIADAPATCGIKASSTFSNNQLTIQASVKTSTGGKYDLGYALLVDNCPGGSNAIVNGQPAYEEKYNNTVLALSGNYENLSSAAQELAKDQEKQIVDYTQTVTLPEYAKLSDCTLVVFALKQNGNDIYIDNAVKFPLGGSVDYIYN